MLPLFGEDDLRKRREINLGGVRPAAHSDILQQAKAQRTQRHELKRKQDSATKIQHWWRGVSRRQQLRRELRDLFAGDVASLTGLRCLVLLGVDQEALGIWSRAVLSDNQDLLKHTEESWRVLLRKTSVLLLQAIATAPESQYALLHLHVLRLLLSSAPEYTQYVLDHGFYDLLGQAILHIPIESKASPSLPLLVNLLTTPLLQESSLSQTLPQVLTHILTIPLLLNRLPLPAVTTLSARLPLSSLNLISPSIPSIIADPALAEPEPKVHLIANLIVLTPPRYPKLPAAAFEAYLELMAALMNALPALALEPPERDARRKRTNEDSMDVDDDDSDDEDKPAPRAIVVASFDPPPRLPELDKRTRTRLQTLPSSQHLNTLLSAVKRHPSTSRQSLIAFCFALATIWPTRRDKVLSTVAIFNGGGLLREIFRQYVRSSPLGQEDTLNSLTNPEYASAWPPLLFLVDLYTQALLTMGDDEFFNKSQSTPYPNPLTLDELTIFSRKMLNIAFTLYWRDDIRSGDSVPGVPSLKWEGARDKLTKCLQAIHARDSRQKFTPPDHWLVTSHVDMVPFIQAAVLEEQNLEQPNNARMLTKRQIAYMSPRLGILNNIPFAIPFEVRVSIFRRFVATDLVERGLTNEGGMFAPKTRVTVRRKHLSQDGFDRLSDVDLHAPVAITFMDKFDNEEAGIDGGGVFKEFLTSLCKEVFDTNRGLWLANTKNELYPAPHAYATEPHSLSWYRFIGRILGKALYDGILVDVAFAGFFLAKWLGRQSFLDDLASLDPEFYRGLILFKHHTGDLEEFALNFTVAVKEFDVTHTFDLIPGGSKIAVNQENRLQYIYLISHYRLTKQIKKQSEAFFEGLSDMIKPRWLRMFNQQELQILLGGVDTPIDVEDLRQHTNYGGLYDDHETTIQLFWKVVGSLDHEQRRKLLRFATSCSRPPLLGFKELVPNFAIRDAGSDENRLPTASTCVNLLKLPLYRSEKVLREKLLQAINSNAGFDLS